tara:strand:+ start:1401 stop:2039 length:639 start_codon:yes stop_codon:yes gene_type:complete
MSIGDPKVLTATITNPGQSENTSRILGNGAELKILTPQKEITALRLVETEGQLKVHTAPYRGSFSVVLSEAIRAAGLGSRVMIAQFLKGGVAQGLNGKVQLCGKLDWIRPAFEGFISSDPKKSDTHLKANHPKEEIREIWKSCKDNILNRNVDQLVLDEIGLAIKFGFLNEEDLLSTLNKRPGSMDIIITGPSIPESIISMADQVTQLRCGI